jgi:Undecaprenyl-phosphate glucose phosphotransferase
MMFRLKLYELFLKVAIYLLPIPVFLIGWWFWRAIYALFNRPAIYSLYGHTGHMLFGTFVWAFVAEHYRVSSFDELFRERTGARAGWSACIVTMSILLAILFFSRNDIFPRGLLVIDLLTLLTLTVLLHAVFRIFFRSKARLAKPIRLLVVGTDQFGADAVNRLRRLSFFPFQIAAHVRLPGQEICASGSPIYEIEQVDMLTSELGIDEAVIAVHPAQLSQIYTIVNVLEHLCVPVRAIVDFGEGVLVRQRLFQLGKIQMLDLTSAPTEYLDYALLKRAFDICFSAGILILAIPLFGLISLIIRLSSPGPVFFLQERIGLNGKSFQMYKFRTMRTQLDVESDTQWTTADDCRKTAFGALLRKTSLDELPQFINVLRGEMSVVGPRPERPYFARKFLQDVSQYNNRHALKVGITGWAQVNGWRGDTSIDRRVACDLYYLQNWSFVLDLQIIVMTLTSGIINRNAY